MQLVHKFGILVSVSGLVAAIATPGCNDDPSDSRLETDTAGTVYALTPTCGDVGTTVRLSFNGLKNDLIDTAVFGGGAQGSGQLIRDEVAKTMSLDVAVPLGAVTGLVRWRTTGSDRDVGVFTIPCPGPGSDAGTDANDKPPVTGPTCGVALMGGLKDVTASTFLGQVSIVPPNGASAALVDAVAEANAKGGFGVGACGDGPVIAPPTDAIDVGDSVSFNDGATKIFDIPRGTNNNYRGFGGVPPLPNGKVITLAMLLLASVTPASVPLGTFAPDVAFTNPVPGGAAGVITKGQPFTFTWTPPTAKITGLYARFNADRKVCVLDPAAGTMTAPGTLTSQLTAGQTGVDLIATIEDKAALEVNGTPCALRTVTLAIANARIDVQ